MTSGSTDNRPLTISRSVFVRFGMDAAERWLNAKGDRTSDMERFGAYMRELRYFIGHSVQEIADDVQMPYEMLSLLEQGMIKPSEVPGHTWAHLMRILEGRQQLSTGQQPLIESAVPPAAPEPAAMPDDPDEAWAMEEPEVAVGPVEPAPARQPAPPPPAPVRTSARPADNIGVARIKVIGIGGGGTNAVSRMYKQRIPGIEYIAINTDAQHLIHLDIPVKLRIGDKLTRGLGVGGNPDIGREAAEESREDITDLLAGTDLCFIACGMGGGTGTGAAPVVAEIAKQSGALTIATVTKPFTFEGKRRSSQAEEGIARMRPRVDTLIVIPNDRLSSVSDERMTAENAFRLADDVLRQGVQSIAELITVPGEINLDFADVKTVMSGAGPAWMAIGTGRGENRAIDAARAAMASPLLDAPIEGATRVLLNITGGADVTLMEVQQAADFVSKLVDPEANIIFGMVTDAKMEDEVRVTVIATGLEVADEVLQHSLQDALGVDPVLDMEEDESVLLDAPQRETSGLFKKLGFGRRGKQKPT